jgi:hypothetical protein
MKMSMYICVHNVSANGIHSGYATRNLRDAKRWFALDTIDNYDYCVILEYTLEGSPTEVALAAAYVGMIAVGDGIEGCSYANDAKTALTARFTREGRRWVMQKETEQ